MYSVTTAAVTREQITMAEKTNRGTRKANLTKGTGALRRYIAEQDRDGVKTQLDKLKVLFTIFEQAHDTYHQTLADESDIETSAEYFNSAEGTYIEEISNAHKWLSPIPVHTSHESVFNSQMIDMLSLPKLTIDVFTGDPLTYKEFMTIFDEVVDSKPVDSHMKLTRLLQLTSGKAKDSIRHCALIGGSRGYEQARRILSPRFGI